jgi:disulfide oxidoreductase YuzD
LAETTRITEFYLQLRYGEAVQVEYVDLADPAAQAEYAHVMDVIEERSLPYPLVAVDGRLRLAGAATYYQVLPLVEEVLSPEVGEVTA